MRLTAKEIADILGVSRRAIAKRAQKEEWAYEEVKSRRGKPVKYFIVDSLPKAIRNEILVKSAERIHNGTHNGTNGTDNGTNNGTKFHFENPVKTTISETDKSENRIDNVQNATNNVTNVTLEDGVRIGKDENGSDLKSESRNLSRNQNAKVGTESRNFESRNFDNGTWGIWLSVEEVAQLLDITERAVRKNCSKGNYTVRTVTTRGGSAYEIELSSLPEDGIIAWIQKHPQEAKDLDSGYVGRLGPSAAWEIAKLNSIQLDLGLANISSDKIKRRVSKKLSIIQKVLKRPFSYTMNEWVGRVALEFGVSEKTIWRDLKIYKEYGALGFVKKRRKGLIRWDREALDYLEGAYLKALRENGGISKQRAYEITVEEAKRRGWKVGSYTSACEHLKAMNHLLEKYAKGGRQALDNYFYIARDYTDLEPFEIIVGDQHRFDFWVRDDETGEVFRPEGFVWLDMRTRLVCGISVAKHYDKYLVAHALRMGLKRYAKFKKCYTDNGKPEISRYMDEIIKEIGDFGIENRDVAELYKTEDGYAVENDENEVIEVVPTRRQWHIRAKVRNAKAKPIERFFNSFEKMLHNAGIPGHVRELKSLSEEKRQDDLRLKEQIEKEKILTFNEFILRVFEVVERYNNRKHSKLGMSPMQALNRAIKDGYVPVRLSDADIDFILLARTTRSVSRGKILLNGELYEGEELIDGELDTGLWHIPDKTRIEVRWDPMDDEKVYAVVDGEIRILHKVIKGSMKDDKKTRMLLEKKRRMINAVTRAYREFTKPIKAIIQFSKTAVLANRLKRKAKESEKPDMDISEVKEKARRMVEESRQEEKTIKIERKPFESEWEYYQFCVGALESGEGLSSKDLAFVKEYESKMDDDERRYWDVYRKLVRKEVVDGKVG